MLQERVSPSQFLSKLPFVCWSWKLFLNLTKIYVFRVKKTLFISKLFAPLCQVNRLKVAFKSQNQQCSAIIIFKYKTFLGFDLGIGRHLKKIQNVERWIELKKMLSWLKPTSIVKYKRSRFWTRPKKGNKQNKIFFLFNATYAKKSKILNTINNGINKICFKYATAFLFDL